ncbi:glycosyltransferase [uncultured Clostridium sp.]|uniref:glycosyltransferase n=1 Tax=uncultured Clostridium sp. TaxID=59620 RepID=UPI0025EA4A49|nr:glycosyltransferase [uncultured Clostridium sp.]
MANLNYGTYYKTSINEILQQRYDKYDILFLSIIDYDFRYQRPQHLANIFSQNGHRVFFINGDFNNKETKLVNKVDNIYVYSLKNSFYSKIYNIDNINKGKKIADELEEVIQKNGVKDCTIIVEYPTWVEAAVSIREKYGFKLVTDYCDDYAGFEDYNKKSIENYCIELFKNSDKIVATSDYLKSSAEKYNPNVSVINNGSEYAYFSTINKIKPNNKRKIIGYYGAIAFWFEIDKIIYLAENLKNVDIILIGEITIDTGRLKKYKNIKLLGEKDYNALLQYLKNFDVCIIPFDTSTNLIKATNPVKFYEYLSAGKKIVATEIPALLPFKEKFLYMANDNEMFLKYVRLCLDNRDNLQQEQGIKFAEQNDWAVKGKLFLNYMDLLYPKVSIIILTYNNQKYTEDCLNSIFFKTAYPNYEIIIVDNNSIDNTKSYLKDVESRQKNVKVIFNDENYGFAKGNNIGIKASDGEYIVLLNNDTIVTRGWLTSFIKHFEDDKNLALIGPVTNNISNEAKIKVNYSRNEDIDYFAYNYTIQHIGQTYDDINVLAMFCVMISRKAFNKIGYLEEEYGIGMFEDDDYSYKAKYMGYNIRCAEDVFIHHYLSATLSKLNGSQYKELFYRNKSIFEKRWNTKWKKHKIRYEDNNRI